MNLSNIFPFRRNKLDLFLMGFAVFTIVGMLSSDLGNFFYSIGFSSILGMSIKQIYVQQLFRSILAVPLVFVIARYLYRNGIKEYGWNKNLKVRDVYLAIIYGSVFGLLSLGLTLTEESKIKEISGFYHPTFPFLSILLFIVFYGLCAGITEETIMRGFLNSELLKVTNRSSFGFTHASFISALAFSLIHLPDLIIYFVRNNTNSLSFIFLGFAFFFGLFLSRLREKSGGLLAPIIAHAVANSFEFILLITIVR